MQDAVTNAAQTQQWSFILSQLFAWVMTGLAWIVPFQARIFAFVLQGESFWSLAGMSVLLLLPAAVFVAGIWGTMVSLYTIPFRLGRSVTLMQSVALACKGVDHMEFAADGRFAIATCEFSGQLVKVDLGTRTVTGYLTLDPGGLDSASMPQDIRSSPDGRVFYVADMRANGVYLVDPEGFRRIGFIATGKGTHGIYPSRDGRFMYVTNRGWNTTAGGRHGPGSVSVLDPRTRGVVATWPVPGGGSPDMGNVSADGKELWVSGRYDEEVYVFDTETGQLTHRIKVGREPHGLCVWPQPGRYSLGHTGNMR